MKRASISVITGLLLIACGFASSVFSPPTSTPQPTSAESEFATSVTERVDLSFPKVSDRKISEYPDDFVLLKTVEFRQQTDKDNTILQDHAGIDFINKQVATLKNGIIEIWSFEGGNFNLKKSVDIGQKYNIRQIRFSNLGNKLSYVFTDTVSQETFFSILDTTSWQLTQIQVENRFGYKISPDGSQFVLLVIRGSKGSIEFRDVNTGQLLYTYDLPYDFPIEDNFDNRYSSVNFSYSSDEKILAVGIAPEMEILILNTDTGTLLDSWVLNSQEGAFSKIIFCSIDKLVVEISTLPTELGIWEYRFEVLDIPSHSTLYGGYEHGGADILSPVCSQDGKQLLIANLNKLSLLDFRTGKVQNTIDLGGSYRVNDVQYHMNDRLLIIVTAGDIQFWGIPSTSSVLPETETPFLTSNNFLRFDGLYQSTEQDYFYYLRFYDDGTVLEVSSTGTPEQVSVWFNKSGENNGVGYYVIQDSTIKFTTTSEYGIVDYIGTINGEELILDTYSHINGNKNTLTYHFVEVSNMQP